MNVFIPYQSPLDCAKALWNDQKRFNKQIVECQQIIDAIDGKEAWRNHPCTLMYKDHRIWLRYYTICLMYYREYKKGYEECLEAATKFSLYAEKIKPYFLNKELCDQHKRRLYTKSPELYPQFAEYGTNEENWYFVYSKLLKYVNGKRIN